MLRGMTTSDLLREALHLEPLIKSANETELRLVE
jgi:hypothetical protein